MACRNGGTVSVIGVYCGFDRQVPDGVGHEPVAHDQDGSMPRPALHEAAARAHPKGRDRSQLRDHATEMKLDDAPEGYKMFRNKQDECMKVVLKT